MQKLDLRELHEIYNRTKEFIQDDIRLLGNQIDYVNPFWKNILSNRRNFPEFNELLAFLRNNLTSGIAYGQRFVSNVSQEKFLHNAKIKHHYTLKSVLKQVPREFIESFDESILGLPYFFLQNSILSSTPFLQILPETYQIISFVEERIGKEKELNILEIGAGWGAVAYQLLSKLNVKNYVICDLHENLMISSFFIQANFPDKKTHLILNDEMDLGENSLVFCSPKRLPLVNGNFDIIINMQSFQEMYVKEVQRYMNFAKSSLTDNGFVFSENGITFNNQKRPERAADYFYAENFEVIHLQYGKRFTQHMFNGSKHEIILAKKKEDGVSVDADYLDACCYLLQSRIDHNSESLSQKLLKNGLDEKEKKFLLSINKFFNNSHQEEKISALDEMKGLGYESIGYYLAALMEINFNQEKKAISSFEYAISSGLSGLALLNALLFLYIMQKDHSQPARNKLITQVTEIFPEYKGLAKEIAVLKFNMDAL
ncbi:MAG: putative sugar O-methyltransferase, partial [Candidatus Hodarchaeota archaeon]